MPFCGQEAELYIDSKFSHLCEKLEGAKSRKAVGYRLLSGSNRKFVFDPNQSSALFIQFDIEPPSLPGVTKIEDRRGKRRSTAWERVFSDKTRTAGWRAKIENPDALEAVIQYLASK